MEQVVAELSELNKQVAVIVGIMKKPQNRFIKVLEIAGTVITVMSLLSVIELIRHWLGFAVYGQRGGLYVFPVNREYIVVACRHFSFFDRPDTQKTGIIPPS